MRKNERRALQCANKIKFASRADARKWARSQRDMRNVTPYECELGDHWHLSSLSKRQARVLGYR